MVITPSHHHHHHHPVAPRQQRVLLAVVVVVASVLVPSWVVSFAPATFLVRRLHQQQAQQSAAGASSWSSSSALFLAKQRKARKEQRVDKSRPMEYMDALEGKAAGVGFGAASSSEGATNKSKPEGGAKQNKKTLDERAAEAAAEARDVPPLDPLEAERQARAADARARVDARPEVSTLIVDEETGMELVTQGKSVMDVVTRKAVQLSTMGPHYRLAQMFPGVPPDIRAKYRFDWNSITVPEMVDRLRQACTVKLSDGARGIPSHPNVASKALDFVLANRDYLGPKMKRTLGRLTMKTAATAGKEQEALELQQLWKHFCLIENHLSAPFRQVMFDAEGRVGPNFGNLDVKSYCSGDLYERAGNYLVLKGMVAHWEKKVVDAEYLERTPQTKDNFITVLSRGDPKRYLPDPPILYTLKECTQVCYMAQQLTKAFVETPELYQDLPVELRFLEVALSIQGGTALRKFIVEEFCPAEEITPAGLREGMRRLYTQLDTLQIDPYADLTNIVDRLIYAMQVGTDDERDPYLPYLLNKDPNGPGNFPTYTFNAEKLSLVRFLDNQYERSDTVAAVAPTTDDPLAALFQNFGGSLGGGAAASTTPAEPVYVRDTTGTDTAEETFYKVPAARAAGRPHELGWLDLLQDGMKKEGEQTKFGKVPPGRIIPDEEAL